MKAKLLVKDAAKDLSLVESGEDLEAEDYSDILRMLNAMMFSWENDGINMGWSEVGLEDEVYIPENHVLGVRFALALMIAPQYSQAQISPLLAAEGPRLYQKIRDYYGIPEEAEFDLTLTRLGWDTHGWNIIHD